MKLSKIVSNLYNTCIHHNLKVRTQKLLLITTNNDIINKNDNKYKKQKQ